MLDSEGGFLVVRSVELALCVNRWSCKQFVVLMYMKNNHCRNDLVMR